MRKEKPPLTNEDRAEKERLRDAYERLKGKWKEDNGRYLSQALLGEIIGEMVEGEAWTQGYIYQLLSKKSDTKLNSKTVQAIADTLGFDPSEVGGRFSPKDFVKSVVLASAAAPQYATALDAARGGSSKTPGVVREISSPYREDGHISFVEIDLANGSLSAGAGSAPVDYQERRSLAFSEPWLRKKGLSPKNLVIIEVSGESMEPRLSSGDVALINTNDKAIKNHKIYALRYGEDLRIKRLSMRYDGAIVISSDNPLPEFKDEVVPASDLNQLHIIGRAVWVGGELN